MLFGAARIAWIREDCDVEWAHALDCETGVLGENPVGLVHRTRDGKWNGSMCDPEKEKAFPDPDGTGTFDDIMDCKKSVEGAWFGEDPDEMV